MLELGCDGSIVCGNPNLPALVSNCHVDMCTSVVGDGGTARMECLCDMMSRVVSSKGERCSWQGCGWCLPVFQVSSTDGHG